MAVKITPEYVEQVIQDEVFIYPGQLFPRTPAVSTLTLCILILQNGFTVVGQSACVDPELYDREVGENIARENAKSKIWPLLAAPGLRTGNRPPEVDMFVNYKGPVFTDDVVSVWALDSPGSGGANHLYQIDGFDSASNLSDPWVDRYGTPARHSTILFQNGGRAEVGANGVTEETLLVILQHRLAAFQNGPFACDDNAVALEGVEKALAAIRNRTSKRAARGVEGIQVA